jgi:thiol-disulfide isomerase/thioredoxin
MEKTVLTSQQRYWRNCLIIAAVIAAGLFYIQSGHQAKPAAEPVFIDVQQRPHTLSEWRGKTVVLNFWASWCQPCREEIPAFIALQTAHADNTIQVIGIAIDEWAAVKDYMPAFAFNYPILIGQEQAINLAVQLGNQRQGLPFTVVISPTGKVLKRHLGAINSQQLNELIYPSSK